MNLNELKEMMKADAVIDNSSLASESLKTHSLYNKYQNIFYDVTTQVIDIRAEYNKLKLERSEYWLGKAPDEVYKNEPKHQKVLKTDVDTYLKGDSKLIEMEKKLQQAELVAKLVDDYLKQISSRNFAIKNAIDMIKFQNGGY